MRLDFGDGVGAGRGGRAGVCGRSLVGCRVDEPGREEFERRRQATGDRGLRERKGTRPQLVRAAAPLESQVFHYLRICWQHCTDSANAQGQRQTSFLSLVLQWGAARVSVSEVR